MNTPGITTNSLIARKVWRAIVINDMDSGESYMVGQKDHAKVPLPDFSNDLKEAHTIVEFFQNKGWAFRVRSIPEDDNFQACFYRDDNRTYKFSKAYTMPMVICEAALAALDGTNLL